MHEDAESRKGQLKNITSKGSKRAKKLRIVGQSRAKKLGLPPGTPIHIGSRREFTPHANLIHYDEGSLSEIQQVSLTEIARLLRPTGVNWVNLEGVHDVGLVQKISEDLDLHPLTQEDIVNTSLRPQFEAYPGYFFFSMKMIYLSPEQQLTEEHTCLILKGNTVLVFQETPGDVFEGIRERLRAQSGRLRGRGADYLLYLLIDAIVDGYYQVVDNLAERIDALEEELSAGPKDYIFARVFEIRREILLLRKNIIPVRDLLGKAQVERTVFQDNTKIFLTDLNSHITQVTETLSLSMEMCNVLLDTYHSVQNQRLNGVMKTLTMISTLFLPLNFLAGIYGMNFEVLPELKWRYGYPATLAAMSLIAIAMLAFFVRKGWLWENRPWAQVLRSRSSSRDLNSN